MHLLPVRTVLSDASAVTKTSLSGAELRQRAAGVVRPDVRAAGAGDLQCPEPAVGGGVVPESAAAPVGLAPRVRPAAAGRRGDLILLSIFTFRLRTDCSREEQTP